MKKGKWWNSLEFIAGAVTGLLLNILSFVGGFFLFEKREERNNFISGNVIGTVLACLFVLIYFIIQAVVEKKLGI